MTSIDVAPSSEQGLNRFEPGSVEHAASVLEALAADWTDERQRAVQLLRVLCRWIMRDEAGGAGGATADDLVCELARSEFSWTLGGDDAKTISKHWRSLLQIWHKRERGVHEKLVDEGLKVGVKPVKVSTQGGTGNRARYYLKPVERAATDLAAMPSPPTEPGHIRYYTETVEPSWLGLLARGIAMEGVFARVYLAGMTALLLAITTLTLAVWFYGTTSGSTYTLLSSLLAMGAIVGLSWLLFRPYRDLIENRIAIAPLWLQPWNGPDDRLLELVWDAERKANRVVMSRYSSKCAVCTGAVRIASGRREFYGRPIGRCNKAPNEHVYSFDPVNRIGVPLRQ